ncbi:glycosyltransferase family 39 protein [Candidatus Poribacteria bacterium]|nr:glycosyltransferase family 39 protein [Candidatus Poribacteria bacterium]
MPVLPPVADTPGAPDCANGERCEADRPFLSSWPRWVFFIALVFLCFGTRMYDLGQKPIMHDESLFVYYAEYQLHREVTYLYQPILHGPAHLWLQAFIFHVFGVSDYTLRLGVAILGFAGFFWVWSLRRWLGRQGTFVALTFYTVSPSIMYYDRFYREDGVFLFVTLWIVASGVHWWHTRSPRWLASFILANVMLFCNKESSLFLYFGSATFLLLLVIHDLVSIVLRGPDREYVETIEAGRPVFRFPPVLLAALVAFIGVTLVLTQVFEGIAYEGSVIQAIGHDFVLNRVRSIPMALGWAPDIPELGGVGQGTFWRKIYILLILGLFVLSGAVKVAVDGRWGRREFLARFWSAIVSARYYLLGSLAAGFAIYLCLFTTAFKHPMGPFKIYHDTLAYWMGQNEWHRIRGPFHMHIVNILVYETPGVVVLLAAWFLAVRRMAWNRATGAGFWMAGLGLAGFHVLFFRHLASPGMPYFGVLALVALGAGTVFVLHPRLGRALFPLAVVAFLAASVLYFNSADWGEFLIRPFVKNGVELAPNGREFLDSRLSLTSGMHLFIIAFLVLLGTVFTWHSIDKGEKFHAFLIWWLITMVGAASYAREKMPQVGIHIAVPLVLLMGTYAEKLVRKPRLFRARWLWVGIMALFAVWNAKAAFALCFRNTGDVREKYVYGDTTRDVKADCEMILRYRAIDSIRAGSAVQRSPHMSPSYNPPEWMYQYNDAAKLKQTRVLVKNPDVIWPIRWYLRDVDWTEWYDVTTAVQEGWPFLFLSVGEDNSVPDLKDKYNIYHSRARMHWTAQMLDFGRLGDFWKVLIPGQYQAGDLKNEGDASLREWKRIREYLLHRRISDREDMGYTGLSSTEYIFCVRKDLGPF